MKKFFFLFSTISILQLSCNEKIEKDFSSPEATLNTFVKAVEQWDTETIILCLDSYDDNTMKYFENQKSEIKELYNDSEFKFIRKDDKVAIYLILNKNNGGYIQRQKDGTWKIVSYKNPISKD